MRFSAALLLGGVLGITGISSAGEVSPPAGNELDALRGRVEALEKQVNEKNTGHSTVTLPGSRGLSISGDLRLRYEFRRIKGYANATDLDASPDLVYERARLKFDVDVAEGIRAVVQLRDSRQWGEETTPTTDMEGLDLHQGYMAFEWKPAAGPSYALTAGRQEMRFGSTRMVALNSWNNTGQTFDGVRGDARGGRMEGTCFATIVKEGGDHADDDRVFGGAFLTGKIGAAGTAEGYLYHRQFTDNLCTNESGLTGDLVDTTLGGRWTGKGRGWDAEVEAAHQFGTYAHDDVSAWMAVVGGGWKFENARWKPRIGLEYDYASGDKDPADGKHQGWDDLFGCRHDVLGYADLTGRSNLHDILLQVTAAPRADTGLELGIHRFLLAQEKDAWRTSSLGVMRRDRTGASGRDLGWEADTVVRWKSKVVEIEGGAAWFLPGDYVEKTGAGTDWAAAWYYLQMTGKF
ncbi:MAG: alginate export family protein [Planctomycetota bacterium]